MHIDVLRFPGIGAFLRWRHVRLALQLTLLSIAVIIVVHGLLGPEIAPRNLATVLTSIHWRGLLILGVVAVGNLFCMACPMVLARDAGRRLVTPRLPWPRPLRRKWIGIGGLALVLFSYELFDLWASPAATAWMVVGYFGLALLVDLLFKGASFCKHVCPVGQFNFIASTLAPTELQVRSVSTCRDCRTSDCIKGQRAENQPVRIIRRGCELGLFLPAKVGNLDCTLCLDCVHACPHDNIALITRVPGLELLETRRRSGIGRLIQRPDLAALATVFTFAALLNAFAMTAPAVTIERSIAAALHVSSEAVALAVLFVTALVIVPAVLLAAAATSTRIIAGDRSTQIGTIAVRYAFALVPLGVGVWLAHYGFHFLTGVLTIVPVTQSAVIDFFGVPLLGEAAWMWTGMRTGSVFAVQIGFVLLGACGSLGLVHATSARDYPARRSITAIPWAVMVLTLAAAALWVLNQPMEMRGLDGPG